MIWAFYLLSLYVDTWGSFGWGPASRYLEYKFVFSLAFICAALIFQTLALLLPTSWHYIYDMSEAHGIMGHEIAYDCSSLKRAPLHTGR